MMYYTVQVATKSEEKFIEQAKKQINDDNYEFIFLNRLLKIQRSGKKMQEIQPIFPGYVFIQTKEAITLEFTQKIRKVNYFIRFLKSNTDITPLHDNDLSIVKHFLRIGKTVGFSKVYFDCNDRIVVEAGPLKGLEGNIIKVDKRKQRAKIKIDFENSPMILDLAFDIIIKTQEKKEKE